jgi:PAS domain S-box-containing protein
VATKDPSQHRADWRSLNRRQAFELLSLQSEVLALLVPAVPVAETVENVVTVLKQATGFDAVGLRLAEGDDYPFLAALGYSDEFLRAENTLLVSYPDGGLCRNEDGSVSLECTCGCVLAGRTDPTNPLFTPGGSAWTNDSLLLLDLSPEQDPRVNPRNRCIHVGFRSIALVPLRSGEEILGLLHLADRRQDCFTLDTIRFFEGVAASMGMALRRKQGEEALEESEARLRLAIDESPVGITSVGLNQHFLNCNETFCDFLGYSEEELKQKTIALITFPEDADVGMADLRAIVAGEKRNSRVQKRYVRKDGAVVWGDVSINLVRDNQGRPMYFLAVIQDITERKESEGRLSRLQQLLGETERIGKVGGWEFDIDTGEQTWTDEIYRIHEVDPDHHPTVATGVQFYTPASRPIIEQAVQRVVESGEAFDLELEITTAKGNRRDVRAIGVADLEHRRVYGFFQDITDHKRVEESLRERDEQLRQSQKMEAVGQLAGGIAHDFNNLLTAIIGYSDLVLSDKEAEGLNLREDVEEIKHAAERAASLTKQILAFSRRQALRPSVVSLNEILAGVMPLLRRTLGEDIDLVSSLSSDLGHAEIDLHQFEQVLMNLALNARDAMPSGGRLTIETANVELDEEYCLTHPEAAPGGCVMLAVSDTGIGMDEATRERVFEPFFTTKAQGAGTGLGLSTVYGIVKQSGGSIFVYSEPAKGTTFKIYLPRAASYEAAEGVAVPDHIPGAGNEIIVVVEDESSLRSLIGRVLGDAGYEVISFESADDAAAAFEQGLGAVDLLLTDVVLPGVMQGNDLARSVQISRPDLPVVYMSGYPRDAIVHAGRLDAGVHFVEKPFTSEALTTIVRTILNRGL